MGEGEPSVIKVGHPVAGSQQGPSVIKSSQLSRAVRYQEQSVIKSLRTDPHFLSSTDTRISTTLIPFGSTLLGLGESPRCESIVCGWSKVCTFSCIKRHFSFFCGHQCVSNLQERGFFTNLTSLISLHHQSTFMPPSRSVHVEHHLEGGKWGGLKKDLYLTTHFQKFWKALFLVLFWSLWDFFVQKKKLFFSSFCTSGRCRGPAGRCLVPAGLIESHRVDPKNPKKPEKTRKNPKKPEKTGYANDKSFG
jgi:hypothetical protein